MTLSLVVWSAEAFAQPREAAISAEAAEIAAEEAREAPREAVITEEDDGHARMSLQYGVQFLRDAPGQQGLLRFRGKKDGWFGAEVRVTPGSDFAWVGRASAGFDVLGKSPWDIDLGLSLGAAGEWSYTSEVASLYATPMIGTEVGLGYEGKKLLAKYRWLAGLGGGPIDELLTEQELTVGFRLFPGLQVYGQYLVLSPGELPNESGVGLGARLVF